MIRDLKLLAGLAFGAAFALPAPAQGGPVGNGDPVREIRLFKPPHEDLRIEWSALVKEDGGEFVVSRRTVQGPPFVVARLLSNGQERYRVVDQAASGTWIYQLRYRSRHGRESVLATIELNLEQVEPGRPHVVPELPGQEAAVRAEIPAARRPVFVARLSATDEIVRSALRGRPPTPPPRNAALQLRRLR